MNIKEVHSTRLYGAKKRTILDIIRKNSTKSFCKLSINHFSNILSFLF